jgi:hypothetical protein
MFAICGRSEFLVYWVFPTCVWAAGEDEFTVFPVNERVVPFEPVVTDEDVMLAAEVDYLEVKEFSMSSAVYIDDFHFEFNVLLDVTVQRPVCVTDRYGFLRCACPESFASDKGEIDTRLGTATI